MENYTQIFFWCYVQKFGKKFDIIEVYDSVQLKKIVKNKLIMVKFKILKNSENIPSDWNINIIILWF